MKILRQTQLELVTVESTLWISIFFALVSLIMIYAAIASGQLKLLFSAGVFALLALVCIWKKTFVFDAMQRVVRWNGRKIFKTESGTIPFDEIADIGTEARSSGDSRGRAMYRLTILTPQGSVPMAYGYGGYRPRYDSLRKTILALVKPESHTAAAPEATTSESNDADDDPSVRSLLAQGRKIDAITLVRNSDDLGFAQAVQRVEEVDKRMKEG
jgi:hypothetical protein